jgi:photosystem II stability/assembly factor-like uncharacterized protein
MPHLTPRWLASCILAVSLLLVSARAAASYGPWHSTELGGGGYILNIYQAPSAPETFYTHIDVGGIYRSDDGARTWRMLHGGLPSLPGITDTASLNVDPRDADTVLAAVGSVWFPPHGVFRTSDGGRTWEKVLAGRFYGNHPYRADGQVLARSPADPDLVLAAGVGGTHRSTDGGRTWTPVGLENLNPVHIQFSPFDPRRVWVCAQPWKPNNADRAFEGGFYRSDDAGLTWKRLLESSPTELAARADADEVIGIFNAYDVRLSRDGGATWQSYGEGLAFSPPAKPTWHDTEDRTNIVAAGDGFWVTASRLGTFYKRPFAASSWEKIPRAKPVETAFGRPWWGRSEVKQRHHFGAAAGAVWLDPRDDDRWLFSDWYGLWRSEDGGASWSLSVDGIESTCVHCIEPDPAVPGRLHLGYWDLGYVSSDDAGTTAHRERAGHVTANFKAIAVSPATPSRILATGDGSKAGWYANTVWRSRDAGSTWQKIAAPGDAVRARYNSVIAHPREPDVFYLAVHGPVGATPASGGLFVTRDAGDTWERVGAGLAPEGAPFFRDHIAHYGPEISLAPDGTLIAISIDHGGLARLPGGAGAWEKIEPPAPGQPRSVVADTRRPGRHFLSLGEDGLWRTDDNGRTWRQVLKQDCSRVALDPFGADRVAVGTLDDVYVSLDGGDTWRAYGEGLPHRWFPVPAFSQDRLLVGTIGSGVFWRELPR